MLRNLLSLFALGETVSGITLTRRFVSKLMFFLGLTLFAAVLASALVLLGFYEFYVILCRHGLDPDMAVLLTAFIALVGLAGILLFLNSRIRQLQGLPFNVSTLGSTSISSLQGVWRGFQRGFHDQKSS